MYEDEIRYLEEKINSLEGKEKASEYR